ncbi:hypothetical protein PAF17_15860 [Paracoccus sp. Z330]|uniref:Uncharacterized protein n=1 Tax=Paracoccus onchidii TaxID=3017813 RepID=A0ABT4ZIR5_9RHOB|nr:hypothetical protein [Paracoccus onchidii]MDB6178967.1 hypothetical protein [Paracoccus onchidii]
MSRSEIIDLRGQVHARTDRAILFSTDGDRESAEWLPLSQIEVGELHRGVGEITLPEWLAVDKGLM